MGSWELKSLFHDRWANEEVKLYMAETFAEVAEQWSLKELSHDKPRGRADLDSAAYWDKTRENLSELHQIARRHGKR